MTVAYNFQHQLGSIAQVFKYSDAFGGVPLHYFNLIGAKTAHTVEKMMGYAFFSDIRYKTAV